MIISNFFKRYCVIFLFLMLVSCGGGSSTHKSPDLSVSPDEESYNFGSIALYSSRDRSFTITNIGDANLTVGDIGISPAGPFSVQSDSDTCSNETLAPNGTCSFTASFSPTSRDQSTATLSIPSNDPAGTATIAFSGVGYGSKISLSESSYDYGGIVLSNSFDHTFEITNTGNRSLTIGDISSWTSGPFSVRSASDTCSNKTLMVDGTCSFTARFSPTEQYLYTSTLSIPSDDPDGPANIDLSGEGYGLNVWISNLQIDAPNCDITLEVTVTDPETGAITGLDEDNFTLSYENGEGGLQTIGTVNNIVNVPVSSVLALDWSESLEGVIDNIYTAANSFLDLLGDVNDEAAAYKFNVYVDHDPINGFYQRDNLGLLKDYIDDEFEFYMGTKLYDALIESIERASTAAESQRPAVVVLSDGHDVNSTYTLDDVIAYAVQEEIPIFSIYYYDPDYEYGGEGYGRPDEVMQPLAEETGGQYFDGSSGTTAEDLSEIYHQVSDVLNNKYTIAFHSDPCEGSLILHVEAEDEFGLYGGDSITVTFE